MAEASPVSPAAPPNQGNPLMGVATQDAPGPMEHFWRRRDPNAHVIPYDELTVRKSLRLFDAMLLDETIAYGHALKRMTRLATGWSLVPPMDGDGNPLPGSEVVLAHVQRQIEQYERFDEFLDQMLDGLRQGFKLGEIVTREGVIDGKRAWVLDDVLVRNSRWFAFDVDSAGRIKPDGVLEYLGPDPDGGGISSLWDASNTARHPTEKFVRWSWNGMDSNAYSIYGRSDFLAIYRAYLLKDVGLKGWGETLDTYRHPIIVGVSRQGLSEAQRQDFLSALVQAVKRKALVVPSEYLPDGMDVEKAIRLHEVAGKADDFSTHEGYLDKLLMRGLMIGQLVSDVGTEGRGSHALGTQHVALFLKVMESVGRGLGRAVSSGLFRKLVRVNLGDEAVRLTPLLAFSSPGDTEAETRSTIVKTLVEAGVVDPTEPWLREYVGDFPRADVDAARSLKQARDTKNAPKEPAGGPPKGKAAERFAASEPRGHEALEAKVDVERVSADLDEIEAQYAADLRDAWARIFNGPGGIKAQARVAMARTDGLHEFSVDYGHLAPLFERYAAESMILGAAHAYTEVNRGREALGVDTLDVVDAADALGVREVATIDLAEVARSFGIRLKALVAKAASRVRLRQRDVTEFVEHRAAQIREEVEAQIARLRKEARQALVAAKARKRKPSAALRNEFRELERKWAGMERALGNEQSALAETIQSSAYNEGRWRAYEAMPATALAGYLYSAVLDTRTTPFCRAWDGYQAPRNHPVWRSIIPPNHWRCRSILVAILTGEVSPQALAKRAAQRPKAKPQKGFTGAQFIPPVPGLSG